MKHNQEFEYFFWGTRDDTQKPLYGLINSSYSNFYLISQDYKILKLTQFIFNNFLNLISVNLTNFENYQDNLIDNSVCTAWGIGDRAGFQPATTGHAGSYQKKIHDRLTQLHKEINLPDLFIQQKLFYIFALLKSVDDYLDQQCKIYLDYDHHHILKKFYSITLPDDHALQDLVEQDIIDLNKLETQIKQNENIVINQLCKLDFSLELDAVKQQVKHYIINSELLEQYEHQQNLKFRLRNFI